MAIILTITELEPEIKWEANLLVPNSYQDHLLND
jgi:hypothetical protein